MNIHLDEKAFKALIANTANFLQMNQAFIEKDYWVTFILKRLSQSSNKDNFIFKGGTSLSKAHKIIERFSEDVDLAVIVNESLSNNQLKKLIDMTSKELTKDLEEVYLDGFTSKHSRFRKTAHKYPIITESYHYGEILTNLILEINSFAQPHPNKMRVLCLERTLVEKILAIIRASYSKNPLEQLKNKIRHIYDIYMILQNTEMKLFLENQEFFTLLTATQADDAKNSEFQGDWTKEKLSDSLIFGNIDTVWEELSFTYHNKFPSLVYGNVPNQEEIKKVLKTVSFWLKKYDNSFFD